MTGHESAAHVDPRIAVTGRDLGHRAEILDFGRGRCGEPPQELVLLVRAIQLPDAQARENQHARHGECDSEPRRTAQEGHAIPCEVTAILGLSKWGGTVTWKPSTNTRW